jgi:hypothetical protein
VVLLAGAHVEKDFISQHKPKKVVIVDPPLQLLLVEKNGVLYRIGIAIPHPQYFLMALTNRIHHPQAVAQKLDTAVNAAVALSGAGLSIDKTYFQRFLQKGSRDDPETPAYNSNPRLAMIEGLQREKESGTAIPFLDLLDSVLSWLKNELKTEDMTTVEDAVTSSTPLVSPLQIVNNMMTRKGNTSQNLGLDKRRANSTVDCERTSERRPQTPIQTHCEECRAKVIVDDEPLFGTQGPVAGLYITKATKACKTGCCKYKKDGNPLGKGPRSIDLVPIDATIGFMRQLDYRNLCESEVALRGSMRDTCTT